MSNYKGMYYALFNKISDIIKELEKIQQETEEMFMSEEKPIIKIFEKENKD